MKNLLLLAFGLAAAILHASAEETFSTAQINFFERKIRPVLVKKCYECHSVKTKAKGGLVLDSRAGVLQGGSSGTVLVPGKPEKSLLIRVLKGQEEDMDMPPKEENRLTENQIADFERWVRMGAPDPRKKKKGGPLAVDWIKARNHWAFQPIRDPAPPINPNPGGWSQNDIDNFVMAKLQADGLSPNPPADRRTLIRRASYTLTGLPPEYRDVEDFVNDPSPQAFDEVVNSLLDSPHYGERWARHWMDVARFADTTGDRGVRRQPRYPYAWTYRDWLINAFNADMPYDKFITYQLAADHVDQGDDLSNHAALGFLTVGKRFMGQINEVIDDRIDVVTQGFMGLTAACARCHDHKFDPIPTKDYYSLHGVFASTREPEEGPIIALPEDKNLYEDYLAEVERLEADVKKVRITEELKVMTKFRGEVGKYLLATRSYAMLPDKKPSASMFARKQTVDQDIFPQWLTYLTKRLRREHDPVFTPWFEFAKLRSANFAKHAPTLAAAIASNAIPGKPINPLVADLFRQTPPSIGAIADAYGRLFKSIDTQYQGAKKRDAEFRAFAGPKEELRRIIYGKNSPIRLERRGYQRLVGVRIRNLESRARGRIAELQLTHAGSPARAMAVQDVSKPRDSFVFIRGESRNRGDRVPRQFLEILSGKDRQPFPSGTSGRLDLAQHIASSDNPLTARVIVNRVWQWHFGKPLVATPGDFGLRSEAPTHPKLLDWLASRFIKSGWSFKELHRLILASSTWQQSSLKNEPGEEKNPTNSLLWRQNIQRLDFESIRDTLVVMGGQANLEVGGRSLDLTDEGESRRTLYGLIDRSNLPELYRIFDFANPDMSQALRYNTTVAQQALFFMNSPIAVQEARNIVNRPEMQSEATDDEKLQYLYNLIYQRPPSDEELNLGRKFISRQNSASVEAPPHLAWEFGYGRYIPSRKTFFNYRPLPNLSRRPAMFLRAKGISQKSIRDGKAKAYEVSISDQGGYFANDTYRAVTRRWTAPRQGVISVSGSLSGRIPHKDTTLYAAVISSRRGQLAAWKIGKEEIPTMLTGIQVEPGETIDFIVGPTKRTKQANFYWAPNITMNDHNWATSRDFAAAANRSRAGAKPLDTWERLAQVMLFGNELIYLN